MSYLYKYLIAASVLISCFCSTAFAAEDADRKIKNYDFKQIKTVHIDPGISTNGPVIYEDLFGIIAENTKYLKRCQLGESAELSNAVVKITILDWRTENEYIPKSDSITFDIKEHYKDDDGNRIYTKTPRLVKEGGYSVLMQYFEAKYEVFDKNNRLLYEYVYKEETRDSNREVFAEATKKFFKEFNKALKK